MDKTKILAGAVQAQPDDPRITGGSYQGAVSLLGLVHGADSHQIRALNDYVAGVQKSN